MIGFGKRISYAFRCFFSILFGGEIPSDVAEELIGSTAQPASSAPGPVLAFPKITLQPESFERAVQMLSLLQRDGRLIDFLSEDVSPYPDAQLGAAVRTVHQSCRQALDQYIKLEPIINSEEDQPVTVPAGFDPALIKVIGNVAGQPPFRGVLRHRGWRAANVTLPSLPQGAGGSVVAQAEVEIP